ncbi:hypothetical protein BASA82_000416 [Batrachochytrium salamandrivorans]|nr:hypothetical protein BASA81_003012 [Batrachochytrium salamandrivorans]KAH9262536.1 hypothetical protein BASA82_000416 [Batrachochytrium salamandrivorans]
MSKLHEIAAKRIRDVAEAKAKVSLEQLEEQIKLAEREFGKPISLASKLLQDSPIPGAVMHVAAEFKRASPSKGAIAEDDMKLVDQVEMYTKAGSSLVSVLTEPTWFKGTLEDMQQAKRTIVGLSGLGADRALVLRKDFIVDEYQLYEAVAFGADTVLLIVAILPQNDELTRLIQTCRKLGMEPLVEAANPLETKRAIQCGAKVLGINNRDLTTFKLDLNTTIECAKVVLPGDDVVILSLSGIKSREDVLLYEPHKQVRGILVGEHLMKCANPLKEIASLVVSPEDDGRRKDDGQVLVKVCGIVRLEDAKVACQSKVDLLGLIFAERSPRKVSVEEAQQVVKLVRDFREATTRAVLDVEPPAGKSARLDWFQRGAKSLQRACKRGPLLVGVFQDQSLDFVNQMVNDVGLDLVQLHGSETWEMCSQVCVPVIKVVHVPHQSALVPTDEQILQSCQPGSAIAILLDTTVGSVQGGTGQAFDWKIAARYKELGIPVIVAGGLTPNNVSAAVKEADYPLAVDCCSGVQHSTGQAREKDPELVKLFCHRAKHPE